MTPAVLLAACAGALLAVGLCDLAQLVAERRARVARAGAASAGRSDGAAAPASAAGRLALALARLGRRLGVPAAPGDLDARLAAAGLAGRLRPGDAMAMKAGAGVTSVLAAAPVLTSLPLRLMVVAVPATGVGGFLAPDLLLARRARRRAARVRIELADVLDLLRVAIAAGLPTGRALAEVGRHRTGLVASELGGLTARLALGVGRAEALADFRARLPVPAVTTLVAAIDRADRHGAPLAPALLALAEEARADRARALHDQAARAAPRLQLAIALLLVPAFLLLIAAGLIHNLT